MDETEELIRLCVRALVAQMSAAPGFELHMPAALRQPRLEPIADLSVWVLAPGDG